MGKRVYLWVAVICLLGVSVGCTVQGRGSSAARFGSPEAAVAELARVVASGDVEQARNLFGLEGGYLLDSGDPALDRNRAARFAEMFKEHHDLRAEDDGRYTMLVGPRGWPFPVPLVNGEYGWSFDAQAGREEIVARRIGENEFAALDTARAVYQAQRRYAARDWDNDGVFHYAERLISTPGNKDGLYWPAGTSGSEASPLNATLVQAASERYVITLDGKPHPYHGYYYKLLSSPRQPGDQGDPLSKPGRYWLLCTPAVWNESGVMTFALNERGWIYEKSLGANLDYDALSHLVVDETWTRVE